MKRLKLTDVQKDVLRFLYAESDTETSRYVDPGVTYADLVIRTSSHAAIRWDAFGGVPVRFSRVLSTVRASFSVRLSTVQALVKKELIRLDKHPNHHGHLTQWGATVASSLGKEQP